jgi:hypothetical protein
MPFSTWHFYGQVTPKVPLISVSAPQRTWDETASLGLHMTFDLEIAQSNVHVTCNVNRDNPNDLSELRMRALEIAKGYVNLISFKSGRAFHVSLDRCILPEGGPETTMLIHNPLLESAATVFANITNFEKIDTIALGDPTKST